MAVVTLLNSEYSLFFHHHFIIIIIIFYVNVLYPHPSAAQTHQPRQKLCRVKIRAAVDQRYLLILGATLPAQIVHRSRGRLAKLVFKHQHQTYTSWERLLPMAEGENLETKIKESLSQGHLPSISLAASPPSPSLQLHEQPAISPGSEMGGRN